MADKKKKEVKVRDLKPSKDAKGGGGGSRSSSSRNLASSFGSAGGKGHTGTGKLN